MKAKEILLGFGIGLIMAIFGSLMMLIAADKYGAIFHPITIYFTAFSFTVLGVIIGIALSRADNPT